MQGSILTESPDSFYHYVTYYTLKPNLTKYTDVIKTLLLIKHFQKSPHFILPSLQPDSLISCFGQDVCHAIYTATPGETNEQHW